MSSDFQKIKYCSLGISLIKYIKSLCDLLLRLLKLIVCGTDKYPLETLHKRLKTCV